MAYELEGTLKEVFSAKTFGKGFTKREFVVTTSRGADDRYPQHIKLSVVKDKCAVLDRFKPGQRVKVNFDLRGSEYNGKYFTELQAFRIDVAGGDGGGGGGAAGGGGRGQQRGGEESGYGDEREDMPF